MSWQSWAANELNQVATYPSPYVNVHKGNMNTMGGSIGLTCLLKRENLAIELNVVSVCITMEELSLSVEISKTFGFFQLLDHAKKMISKFETKSTIKFSCYKADKDFGNHGIYY